MTPRVQDADAEADESSPQKSEVQVADPVTSPDVSVIIPTFNVVDWIDDCLTSILDEQTLDLEVVLVDDGSTDGTWTRVLERAAHDPRIRAVRMPGTGGGQCRNYGAELARGRYIAFCDGDDIVPAGAYATMHASAAGSGSDMVIGDFLKFSALRTWSPTGRWNAFGTPRAGIRLVDHPVLIRNRACWNRLFSREFWQREAIRFPSVPRSNDVAPMTAALVSATSIDVLPDIVYLYRDRPGASSMTSQARADVSLRSYLSQEIVCAALVAGVEDPGLTAVFWSMFLDADGWVHVRRYLQEPTTGQVDAELPALLTRMLGSAPPSAWQRLSADRQAVYSLFALGHHEWARAVVGMMGEEDRPFVPLQPREAMQIVAVLVESSRVPDAGLHALAYRYVVESMTALPTPLSEPEAQELLAVVAGHEALFDSPVGDAERPHDARIRQALATGDVSQLLRTPPVGVLAAVRARSVVVGRRAADVVIERPVRALDDSGSVTAVKPGSPASRREVATLRGDGGGTLRFRVPARALPSQGTWVFEITYPTSGGAAQSPLVVERSAVTASRSRWRLLSVSRRLKRDGPVSVVRLAAVHERMFRRAMRSFAR